MNFVDERYEDLMDTAPRSRPTAEEVADLVEKFGGEDAGPDDYVMIGGQELHPLQAMVRHYVNLCQLEQRLLRTEVKLIEWHCEDGHTPEQSESLRQQIALVQSLMLGTVEL